MGRARFLWTIAFVTAAAHGAAAQDQPGVGPWREPLLRQMQREENCTVAYIGEVLERQDPTKYLVRAKVTCQDQRVFTVEQNGGPEQPFRIVQCNREGPSC